jgi:DNA-binding MarR family transcriptional regulator
MPQINAQTQAGGPSGAASASGCTCFKLRRLSRRVTAVYDRALAETGMRVTQYTLLVQLRRAEQISMSELAELLDMDRTTLTRNLKALIELRWVEVKPAKDDARVRLVRITDAGIAQLRSARAYWQRAQDEVKATIGPANLAGLHELLDRYVPFFRPATGTEGSPE